MAARTEVARTASEPASIYEYRPPMGGAVAIVAAGATYSLDGQFWFTAPTDRSVYVPIRERSQRVYTGATGQVTFAPEGAHLGAPATVALSGGAAAYWQLLDSQTWQYGVDAATKYWPLVASDDCAAVKLVVRCTVSFNGTGSVYAGMLGGDGSDPDNNLTIGNALNTEGIQSPTTAPGGAEVIHDAFSSNTSAASGNSTVNSQTVRWEKRCRVIGNYTGMFVNDAGSGRSAGTLTVKLWGWKP